MQQKSKVIDLLGAGLQNLSAEYIESLQEYYDSIIYLSDNKFNLEFNNKDEYHASLVMSLLFQKAQSKINIFAGDFGGKICDTELYMTKLREALTIPNLELNVIFEKAPKEDSLCYKYLYSEKRNNNRIKLRRLNQAYRKNIIDNFGKIEHFTVVDESMFRYETDIDEYKAFCNFDDKVNASLLSKNYGKLYDNSEEI